MKLLSVYITVFRVRLCHNGLVLKLIGGGLGLILIYDLIYVYEGSLWWLLALFLGGIIAAIFLSIALIFLSIAIRLTRFKQRK